MTGLIHTAFMLALLAAGTAAQEGPRAASTATQAPSPRTPPAKPRSTTFYRNVTVIDGTGAPPKAGMTLVVSDGRIAAIVPASAREPSPLHARQVDASGLYVIPGLVDTHVHLATKADRTSAHATMRRYLYSGITSVRDMAGDVRALGELQRESLLKEIDAPDLYYASLMAGPSFFTDPRTGMAAEGLVPGKVPWMQEITDDTDMVEAVAIARGTNAAGIKIYANLPGELVRRIAAEGERQGIKVWAHAMVSPALPSDGIEGGVDVVSHVCTLGFEAMERRPTAYADRVPLDNALFAGGDNPVLAGLYEGMKSRGTILDATIRLTVQDELAQDTGPTSNSRRCNLAAAAGMVRQAYRAGVLISTGTDGDTPWDDPYPALQEEMEALANDVGMEPLDVIRAATEIGARTLGKEAEFGTIAPGKAANLVFLSRDPSADIANIRSVVFTVKRGSEYQRSAYRPITRQEAGE